MKIICNCGEVVEVKEGTTVYICPKCYVVLKIKQVDGGWVCANGKVEK